MDSRSNIKRIKHKSVNNKALVLNKVSECGSINRSEIAKQLGLSIPTIMKITDEFVNDGILEVVGKAESRGGKRPELYKIVDNAYYTIAVDLGRSKIIVLLVNLSGKIVKKVKVPLGDLCSPENVFEFISSEISSIFDSEKIDMKKILGIGLGVPGIIDKENGIILYSPDFGWENVDLLDPLKKKFGLNVYIENSTKAMVIAEKALGAATNAQAILGVNVGHGIGGAIFAEDQIALDSGGIPGEIGHIILQKDGPLCDCGKRGCLEAIASGNAIAKKMHKKEAKEVFDLARAGDKEAMDVILEAIDYLGTGIAGMINVLGVDCVVLHGGIMNSYDIIEEPLLQNIQNKRMKYVGRNVKICKSVLGGDATALGMANIILSKFKSCGGGLDSV